MDKKIITELSFKVIGISEEVYKILEQFREIVSETNNDKLSNVEIITDVSSNVDTGVSTNESEKYKYEDNATLLRYEELQESDVDLDALIYLNKLNRQVEEQPIEDEVLLEKINYFSNEIFPKVMKEIVDNIKENIEGIQKIEYSQYDDIMNKRQHLILGELKIELNKSVDLSNYTDNMVKFLKASLSQKGLPKDLAKNIIIKII